MKLEKLNISLLQLDLVWESALKNRNKCESYFASLSNECHLVVLPEMFTTGFTMNPESVAESMDGKTVKWLKDWASKLDTAICGSMIITDNGQYYNRFLFVKPSGDITFYDKRHTFTMAGEGKKYTAGESQEIIEYLGWKILPQVCYDLRFPVFARNTMGYDVLIYVANWPKTRVTAWDTLLKARAIENMSYCIGVNRIGTDGNSLEYTGHSRVYDVLGNDLSGLNEKEGFINVTLFKSHIKETRDQLPFLKDMDHFTLQ